MRAEDTVSLRPVDFLVLLGLADGPLHGYGVVRRIAEETGGAVRLVPGNLYAVLRRLLEQGLLEETDKRLAPELDDARRRYYQLTSAGRAAAAAEAARLETLVEAARRRRLLQKSTESAR